MASCHLLSQSSDWVISFTNNTASRRASRCQWGRGRDSSDGCWEGYGDDQQTGWRGCGGCPGGAWTAAGCGLGRC